MQINITPYTQHPYDYFAEDKDSSPESPYLDEDEEMRQIEITEAIRSCPSDFVKFAIYMPVKAGVEPFSFKGRRYLQSIYDTPAKRKLLFCGRQVEKCLSVSSLVSLAGGRLVKAEDLRVGDSVVTMGLDGSHTTVGKITWISQRLRKPCARVTTRQGHEAVIALTHPLRQWDRWTEGSNLQVGDRVAVVRKAGLFNSLEHFSEERIRLTAYLIGDGCLHNQVSFTSLPGRKLKEFLSDLCRIGGSGKLYNKKDTRAKQVKVHLGPMQKWLIEDGLYGRKSASKFLPSWVFQLDCYQSALFLNRLWSTDGHVKQNNRSKYSLEYCSISLQLIRDVQALLWKFGIPSRIRKNIPSMYRHRRKKTVAYILRIETKEGVYNFLSSIGSLGKSEAVPLPSRPSNNNRDTYPKELNGLIRQILHTREPFSNRGRRKANSPNVNGLRHTLKYPPTKAKIEQYVAYFRTDSQFDQRLVDVLESHLSTDLYWDKIVKIAPEGIQECIDLEVEGTSNFIADGLVAHNSTFLGNLCLSYASINPFFKVLYVSPSNQQTKVFSRDRIKEPMEISPVLRYFSNSKLLANVLEKKFINGSQITLRFAFLNADRCRGIPADMVSVDEFQDIILDNIPVIEECASHSSYKLFTYSGTPKSLDNSLEHYWSRFSTQNEWMVPCKHHGTPGDKESWHWNNLGEEHIGDTYLICDKCGKRIFPDDPDCRWVSMNPHLKIEKPFEGYRISQLMVPWTEFKEIKDKQKKYSRAKFHNEVLGRSYDSGTRPLTRGDVQRNCWDQLSMQYYRDVIQYTTQFPVFMGADWGTGENTYTVIALGGYLPFAPERFTIFYLKRFEGMESEPRVQLDVIKQLARTFNVRMIGSDYGGGHFPNDELVREFGANLVKKYQWVGNVKKKIAFEPRLGVPRFLCHRTEVMSDIFNAIKRANVFYFPRWEEFEDPHGMDMLNIFSEYNERLRMNVYKHAPGCPDDSFHAIVYCFLASFFFKVRPDVILPTKEVDREREVLSDEDLDIL